MTVDVTRDPHLCKALAQEPALCSHISTTAPLLPSGLTMNTSTRPNCKNKNIYNMNKIVNATGYTCKKEQFNNNILSAKSTVYILHCTQVLIKCAIANLISPL